MNIYVGNLNYRVKEADLQQVMEDYGAVSSVKIIMDRETGKSKGFAFIEMEDDNAAAKAIAELNGAEYMGRALVVKEARPRDWFQTNDTDNIVRRMFWESLLIKIIKTARIC